MLFLQKSADYFVNNFSYIIIQNKIVTNYLILS